MEKKIQKKNYVPQTYYYGNPRQYSSKWRRCIWANDINYQHKSQEMFGFNNLHDHLRNSINVTQVDNMPTSLPSLKSKWCVDTDDI